MSFYNGPLMGQLDPEQQKMLQQQMLMRSGMAMLAGSGQGNNNASVIGQGLLGGMQSTDQMLGSALQHKMWNRQQERMDEQLKNQKEWQKEMNEYRRDVLSC